MKKTIPALLVFMASALLVSNTAFAQSFFTPNPPKQQPPQQQQQQQGLPQPKILMIDQNKLLLGSKVGQDVARQVQAYTNQAKADLQGQAHALEVQGQALQQQVAILAPDVKAQKIKEFESKQAGLQAAAQKKQAMIQGGFMQARQAISAQLGPILKQLVMQRGANLIIDKNAVLMATDDRFDITDAAVALLNQKMASYKVQLVMPPAGTPMPQ
jgi:outer membrane protein